MLTQHAVDPQPHTHFLRARFDVNVARPQLHRVDDDAAAQLHRRHDVGRLEIRFIEIEIQDVAFARDTCR